MKVFLTALVAVPVWGVHAVDLSQYYPSACIAQGHPCYRVTTSETQNRFSECCAESDGSVSMTCDGGLWNAVCTPCPNKDCSKKLPTFDPKGVELINWGVVEVSQSGTGYDDCPEAANLGPSLSKSTGFNDPFPLLGITNPYSPVGRESEVGFLVGGNYYAPLAAEIEGNIVVLGDFVIGPSGTNSLGTYFLSVFC